MKFIDFLQVYLFFKDHYMADLRLKPLHDLIYFV